MLLYGILRQSEPMSSISSANALRGCFNKRASLQCAPTGAVGLDARTDPRRHSPCGPMADAEGQMEVLL